LKTKSFSVATEIGAAEVLKRLHASRFNTAKPRICAIKKMEFLDKIGFSRCVPEDPSAIGSACPLEPEARGGIATNARVGIILLPWA
jgi:hypothetical protein